MDEHEDDVEPVVEEGEEVETEHFPDADEDESPAPARPEDDEVDDRERDPSEI
jgi:hypothetical protein